MPTNIFNVSQRLTQHNEVAADQSGATNATTSVPASVKLPSAATPDFHPENGGEGASGGPGPATHAEVGTLSGSSGGKGHEQELGARNGLIAEEDEEDVDASQQNGHSGGASESDGKDRLAGRKPNSTSSQYQQSSNGIYSSDRQLTESPSHEESSPLPPHDHSNIEGDQYDHQTRPPPSHPPSFSANAPSVPFRTLPGGGKRLHKNSFVDLVRSGKVRSKDKSGSGESEEGGEGVGQQDSIDIKRKDFVSVYPPGQKNAPVSMSTSPSSSTFLRAAPQPMRSQTLPPPSSPLKRTNSLPHDPRSSNSNNPSARASRPPIASRPTVGSKWGNLKAKLQRKMTAIPQEESKQAGKININDELMVGALGVVMMKMSIDRDEKGRRRVPVFLHHIKFRVVDSVGGMGNHPIFRIECQYGDGPGAVKWVLYRNLRDFLSLHAHYKAAGLSRVTNRSTAKGHVEVPEFPKSSIPYFQRKKNSSSNRQSGRDTDDEREPSAPPSSGEAASHPMGMERGSSYVQDPRGSKTRRESVLGKLKGEKSDGGGAGGGKSRANFAKNQREALEDYLVGLVKAIMLRPEANRLIRFLEISALTLSLAQGGGAQGKSGYLRVASTDVSKKSDRPMLAPVAWAKARKPKWWVVRESYLIAVDEPDQTEIFDVFPFDQDFSIERPKRALRRGANKLEHWTDKAKGDGHSIADSAVEAEARLAEIEGSVHGTDRATITSQDAELEGRKENSSHHTFYVNNSQGRLKFVAKNVRQMQQFIVSLERMASESIWAGKNRFDSFAPIRLNVAAEWLVDARDYMWSVSRALLEAKKCVYIHDWWLSPELYMRRPSQEKYRLDNILKKIAERGVKIHVIVYNEVSNKTTPTDSQYTKVTLRGLHPNIFVQRSPNHFNTGTFYWSHHEKMCVIDERIAFMGGVDLCFGRWDTPQHSLVDDDFEPNTLEGEAAPIWPGKDYSNPRVMDFHTLNKPFDDIYDRAKVPRMPWHDIAMQMVGQPARDLCRHFIQRWNHLLRIKNHSQKMPFLVPPPDFTVKQLQDEGLTGTCEIQVCRSCGPWSMGTNNRIEHSIQNAYLKAIQLSEHFVYIENQFFITSTVVDGIVIENQIGDALVNRIIQAHEEGTPWRACIVIPLLPGYTYPVDSDQASSVRLILECQNKTICRGPNSIFSRLRQAGIDPDDYISFFSLRGWGKFKDGVLTTEMVYIHAKAMIVDDRVAIIGSANINERSMRGDRDSELASVIRDTDMIDSKMAGKPYKVGRFAHTLRMRLMREHLGIDVDAMEEDDLLARDAIVPENDVQIWDPDLEQGQTNDDDDLIKIAGRAEQLKAHAASVTNSLIHGQTHNFQRAAHRVTDLFTKAHNDLSHPDDDIEVMETEDGGLAKGFASSVVPTMEERRLAEHNLIQGPLKRNTGDALGDIAEIVHDQTEGADQHPVSAEEAKEKLQFTSKTLSGEDAAKIKEGRKDPLPLKGPGPGLHHAESEGKMRQAMSAAAGMEDDGKASSGAEPSSLGRKKTTRKAKTPWDMPLPTPKIDPDGLSDPLDERFWKDTWVAVAVHNTEVHRKVFRSMPDDLVTTWAQYQENISHAGKFNLPPSDKDVHQTPNDGNHKRDVSSQDGQGAGGGGSSGGVIGQGLGQQQLRDDVTHKGVKETVSMQQAVQNGGGGEKPPGLSQANEGWNTWERERMEELLGETRGHLVVYPTRFLEAEDLGNNFLFNSDRILPLPIYD